MEVYSGKEKFILAEGDTVFDMASKIGGTTLKELSVVRINGVVSDANTVLNDGDSVEFASFDDEEALKALRLTCCHIFARAVKNIFPTCKLGSCGVKKDEFFYDVDFVSSVQEEDLIKIEEEMRRIIRTGFIVEKEETTKQKAIEIMSSFGEVYKIRILESLPSKINPLSIYKIGGFVDYCGEPLVYSVRSVKAFRLNSIAGAYWKNNNKNKMLTRIYGTAFFRKKHLSEYLKAKAEAQEKNYAKICKRLGYYSVDEKIGKGLPQFFSKGYKVIQTLQRFVEDEEEKAGFSLVKTPCISKAEMFALSGQTGHYKDKMYSVEAFNGDNEEYVLRPGVCQFHYSLYDASLKSYRLLPVRFSETATVFRKEASGETKELIRLRQFTVSDGHCFLTPEQIESEFRLNFELTAKVFKTLGIYKNLYFSVEFIGEDREKFKNKLLWDKTEKAVRNVFNESGTEYTVENVPVNSCGPRVKFFIKNVYGNEEEIMTFAFDFNASKIFSLHYVNADGKKKNPIVLHRSSIGCYEKILAILIEKYAGNLPLWLSPEQVRVLSVAERNTANALELKEELLSNGIRTACDVKNDKTGRKVREAVLEKTPYIVLVGDKEANGEISVRSLKSSKVARVDKKTFIEKIKKLINEKII